MKRFYVLGLFVVLAALLAGLFSAREVVQSSDTVGPSAAVSAEPADIVPPSSGQDVSSQQYPAIDYGCFITPGTLDPPDVDLATQFGFEIGVDVSPGYWLCAPTTKDGTPPPLEPHLRCFEINEPAPGKVVTLNVPQFGVTYPDVTVGPARELCAPTSKEVLDPVGGGYYEGGAEPHYKCYELSGLGPIDADVTLTSQFWPQGFGTTVYDPVRLCLPTGKNGAPIPDAPHLVGYMAYQDYPITPGGGPWTVGLLTQFGPETVPVFEGEILLVPAEKEVVPPEEPIYPCWQAGATTLSEAITLETQFGYEGDVTVDQSLLICNPGIKTHAGGVPEGTLDAPHLRFHFMTVNDPVTTPTVNLYDQFGTWLGVELYSHNLLAAPAFKTHDADPLPAEDPPLDPHYSCYYLSLPYEGTTVVTIQDQFFPGGVDWTVEVAPFILCLPAGKNQQPIPDASHLLCHWAGDTPEDPTDVINTKTQFAEELGLDVSIPDILCVPAVKEVVSGEQDPSLSLHETSPTLSVIPWAPPGVVPTNEGDILDANAPGPPVDSIGCGPAGVGLGLPGCAGPATDELNAMSYGVDFTEPPPDGEHWLYFSVAPGDVATGDASSAGAGDPFGVTASAVAGEFSCVANAAATTPAPEAAADVFGSKVLNDNVQDLDGDGFACNGNAAPSLGLTEPISIGTLLKGDDVDALDEQPVSFVDPDANGTPNSPVYFTLDSTSPSIGALIAGPGGRTPTPDDIFVCDPASGCPNPNPPRVYADGQLDLGLLAGDEIDAFCLQESGDAEYQVANDKLYFSLSPASPLVTMGFSAAAIFQLPAGFVAGPQTIGLLQEDDVNAMKCFVEQSWPDDDLDNMPDQWEAQQTCGPLPDPTDGDFDDDGVQDDTEYFIGTDPCVVDTDDDGCADSEELGPNQFLGGGREPTNRWDFFDVPQPVGAPGTGVRDNQVDGNDALAVNSKFGASPGDPIPTAPKYDPAYDRSAPTPNSWNTQAPNLVQDGNDTIWALNQFGHSCVPAP